MAFWASAAWGREALGVGVETCVCVCGGGGVAPFAQAALWTHPFGHTCVLGLGCSPLLQALLGQGCVPVCPSTSVTCILGEILACCPRTTLKVGW